jgi:pilus assembly protein FimV
MINKLSALLLLLVFSTVVNALGLGGISVNSALNEPLDARIQLISASPTQIEDLRVGLASADVFRRAGIDRPFLLSKLRFKAIASEQGASYIQVTTRETIREPFLDFLIEVSWAGGSLIREFTVLLDPPTYQAPRAQAAVPQKTSIAATKPQPTQQSVVTTYGPIRSSETLWVIAGKVQPDKTISRNQTMVALLKANPDAFQYGNINLLNKGAVLTVPSAEEIASIGASEAQASVKQQMAEWRRLNTRSSRVQPEKQPEPTVAASGVPPLPETVTNQSEPSEEQQETVAEPAAVVAKVAEPPEETLKADSSVPEGQRLRVVDADRSWQLSDKSELSYPAQESDKLREAIKDSEQELAAVQDISQDIVELRAALESKVQTLKKALEEKDVQLESLRKQIEQVGLTAGSVAGGQASSSSTDVTALKPDSMRSGNVTTDSQVTESRPLESYWKNDYWMILMGIIILILASMLLFGRRRRDSEDAFETPDLFQMSSQQVMVGDKQLAEPVARIDELFESPLESHTTTSRETASDTTSMFPEQGVDIASILTEADIYLAYRRYSQAETLVEEAMALNPESPELKAKLLEIYAFRRDKKAFSRYLDQVYATLMVQSPELWEKIVEMGHDLVPDHVAWGTDGMTSASLAPAPAPAPVDEDEASFLSDDPLEMDMDLDLGLDDLNVPDVDSGLSVFDDLEEESDDDLSSFDIDLGDQEDPTKDK